MVKLLCIILTLTKENVKHDKNAFFIYCVHVLHSCAHPKQFPTEHNSVGMFYS